MCTLSYQSQNVRRGVIFPDYCRGVSILFVIGRSEGMPTHAPDRVARQIWRVNLALLGPIYVGFDVRRDIVEYHTQ